jgi:hypothetical protein
MVVVQEVLEQQLQLQHHQVMEKPHQHQEEHTLEVAVVEVMHLLHEQQVD